MQFEAYYPINPTLKKHIQYYYFVRTSFVDTNSKYLSFPNITLPVNIHKNISANIEKTSVELLENTGSTYTTIINGMRETPLQVSWKAPIDKVTIAFKPGCLNNFIHKTIENVVKGYTTIFNEWNHLPAYEECLDHFYGTDIFSERVQILEKFLLEIYQLRAEHTVFEKAVQLLSDFDNEITVADAAKISGLHERTFTRKFSEYIGISPRGFKKIARFRHSLNQKVQTGSRNRLTDISYESNYYDQAYFVKMYHKLTGKNPKLLFKTIEALADNNVIFEFIK